MRTRIVTLLVSVAGALQLASCGDTENVPGTGLRDGIPADGQVLGIVTTASSVCWSAFAAGSPPTSLVACASKTADSRVEIVRDGLVHPRVAVSGDTLYWSTEKTGTIDAAPTGGGLRRRVVTSNDRSGSFAVVRDELFFTLERDPHTTILFGSANGAPPTEIAQLPWMDPHLFAVHEYSSYDRPVAFTFGDGVRRHKLNDGPSQQLAGGCFYPVDLVADERNVYWVCQDRTARWVPHAGGTEHVLHDVGFGRIATWQGRAYLADEVGRRVIRLIPEGGRMDVLRTDLDAPGAITADSSGVYVGAGTQILRLPL